MAVKRWVVEAMHGGWVRASVTLANGDTSTGLQMPGYPKKTVHVVPDSGVTITAIDIKGANIDDAPDAATNDADYSALRQEHLGTVNFSALGAGVHLAGITENPRYIKVTDVQTDGDVFVEIVGYTAR